MHQECSRLCPVLLYDLSYLFERKAAACSWAVHKMQRILIAARVQQQCCLACQHVNIPRRLPENCRTRRG